MVVDAIGRTDMDLRKALFANIVLSGGATLTKGFGDRLLLELQRLAVKDMRIKIFAPPERKYSTWIGGSILAGLSTFRKVIRLNFIACLVFRCNCFFAKMLTHSLSHEL
jgi:centractin